MYCVQSDLEKQLPPAQLIQLTDDDGDGAADSGVVTDNITRADNEINAYCAKRYTVPFAPVPDLIKTLSVDIAIWNLHKRRGIERDAVNKAYARAIQLLKDIASGTASLGVTPGPAESEAGGPQVTTEVSDARVFTKETLEHF